MKTQIFKHFPEHDFVNKYHKHPHDPAIRPRTAQRMTSVMPLRTSVCAAASSLCLCAFALKYVVGYALLRLYEQLLCFVAGGMAFSVTNLLFFRL